MLFFYVRNNEYMLNACVFFVQLNGYDTFLFSPHYFLPKRLEDTRLRQASEPPEHRWSM